jgi:hypothetical protein
MSCLNSVAEIADSHCVAKLTSHSTQGMALPNGFWTLFRFIERLLVTWLASLFWCAFEKELLFLSASMTYRASVLAYLCQLELFLVPPSSALSLIFDYEQTIVPHYRLGLMGACCILIDEAHDRGI